MGVMYDLPEHKGKTRVVLRDTDITGETFPSIEDVKEPLEKTA